MTDRDRLLAQQIFRNLLVIQHGVVTWAQLRASGLAKHQIDRRLRHRELVPVHPRVYVVHTGPLTWEQRVWAALLYAEPAALCWTSMGRRPDKDGPVHVAIAHSRRVAQRDGVVIHRVNRFTAMRRRGTSPPRLSAEDNALLMASAAASEADVIAILADVWSGPVAPPALRGALDRHPRLRRRRWISAVIDDLETGACSVLEHGYLVLVERAHGLPRASRQTVRIVDGRREVRDVEYDVGLVVELDGWLNHDSWKAGERDADRDLDDLADGKATARLRWGQVFARPCRTAERIGRILQRRGWTGHPTPCGPDCPITGA